MINKQSKLPDYIPPMLAKLGKPFDSADYLFEIKWDGTRAVAYIEQGTLRLMNRRRLDISDRYPDLTYLRGLPSGTVLDGEIVVIEGGKPDFNLLQSREQAQSARRIRNAARAHPATYMVFDQMYREYRSVMDQPLDRRRAVLRETVGSLSSREPTDGYVVVSEGVVGQGLRYFAETARRGLEGVVAKRLTGRYLPGKRTDAWIKIKQTLTITCAIIGFVPSGEDDFRSLIIAAADDGGLRCVGKVGTGFDRELRERINELLWSRLRNEPVIPCNIRGNWIEPGLFCNVGYYERTKNGELRAPVFLELFVE
jgi:bifunctional non-homologous end joining protein LigD